MINVKKMLIFIITFILLFQESIQRIIFINMIDMLDEAVVVLFSIVALGKILKTKTISKKVLIMMLLLVAFLISGTVSLYVNSSHIFSRYVMSAFLAIKCFLLIIDISIIGFKEDTKEICINALNTIGIICCVIALLNFFSPSIYAKIFSFAIVTYRFGFVSITSLFYHTGRFGWFMLFLSIINYSIFKEKKITKNKYLFLIFGFFSLLSFRTKVIFSVIAILLFDLFLSKKIKLKKIVIASIIGIAIFIFFNNIIMNTYHLYFDDNNKTLSARQSLTENSYKIVKDYFPLGVGFGKYGSWYARKYYSEYYYRYKMNYVYGLTPPDAFFATDTFWAYVLGETGFIGFVFYISFLLYIYTTLKKEIDIKNNSIYIYSSILILVQSIIESFGEQSFNSPPQYIFLAFAIGIAIHEAINSKEKMKVEIS